MEQNKTRTYILYAIGEIFLVVIGILIALQVNNWNEQRKDQQVTKNILRQIQSDLLTDIRNITTDYRLVRSGNYNGLEELDKFINREFTKEELGENVSRGFIAQLYRGVEINTKGYQKLMEHLTEREGSYEPLIQQMDELYNIRGNEMLVSKEEIRRRVNSFNDYLQYETSLLGTPRSGDAWIEFILTSPVYRGQAVQYRATLSRLMWNYRKYLHLATLLYKDIGTNLGEESLYPAEIRNRYLDLPIDSLTKYQGVYTLRGVSSDAIDSLVITEIKGLLQVQNYIDFGYGFRRGSSRTLYAFTDSTFYLDGNYSILIDRKGKLKLNPYNNRSDTRTYLRSSE